MPPQAASGLSRAPIPSGIRGAARERMAAVRKPRGDVATESRSLFLREGREGIHNPPPPANESERAAAICRSGVRAAARNRPDLRASNSHQAMPRA